MQYNFDQFVDRRGTGSSKWDSQTGPFGAEGLLPFWVADSDFAVLPEIQQAMAERIKHPVFGYTVTREEYYTSIQNWTKSRYGYEIQKEWIVPGTGVMGSVAVAVQSLTEPGDKIIIETPVYPPFHSVISLNDRVLIKSELKRDENNHYTMDFEDLEQKIKNGAKMILLCNPHNPVGRVWSHEEMAKVVELCSRYGIYLVSDEIHCDIIMPGHKLTSAMCFDSIYDRLVVCIAPSKTFNIAGLSVSNALIPGKETREKVQTQMSKNKAPSPNILSKLACEAAYTHGARWVDQMNEYLQGNMNYVYEFCKEKMPDISVTRPEGTYLIWVDFGVFGKTSEEIIHFLVENEKIGLGDGTPYSETAGKKGFIRLNAGCPMSTLKEGMDKLYHAYTLLKK